MRPGGGRKSLLVTQSIRGARNPTGLYRPSCGTRPPFPRNQEPRLRGALFLVNSMGLALPRATPRSPRHRSGARPLCFCYFGGGRSESGHSGWLHVRCGALVGDHQSGEQHGLSLPVVPAGGRLAGGRVGYFCACGIPFHAWYARVL
jgi:hypothetical protein